MKKFVFLILIFLFFSFVNPAWAVKNNKFGIHITQTEDLIKAAELVNSFGGDWGYVTIVIQENDRNNDKWQGFFDRCREKHLIPLVRIATYLDGSAWKKPSLEVVTHWANFLDSLNWPTKIQHVIVFNEPNHAKEWSGQINPGEYARILEKALTVFGEKNDNFLILNAGLDQAAPNSSTTMEESRFLIGMEDEVPGIFSKLENWTSHSYPNHGFIGKPWEVGQATVKGYRWELEFLKNSFGIDGNLPVFITETGWPHGKKFHNETTAADFIKRAFEETWFEDEQVVAVTPFILNYPFVPFESFSWLDFDGRPYPQYQEVQKIEKIAGKPIQIEKYEIVNLFLPSFLPANFAFKNKVSLKNTGQSIWGEKLFVIKSRVLGLNLTDLALPEGQLVKPGEMVDFEFTLETLDAKGDYDIFWEGFPKHEIKVFEAWKLTNNQDTFFNKLFKRFVNFRYR